MQLELNFEGEKTDWLPSSPSRHPVHCKKYTPRENICLLSIHTTRLRAAIQITGPHWATVEWSAGGRFYFLVEISITCKNVMSVMSEELTSAASESTMRLMSGSVTENWELSAIKGCDLSTRATYLRVCMYGIWRADRLNCEVTLTETLSYEWSQRYWAASLILTDNSNMHQQLYEAANNKNKPAKCLWNKLY